MVGGMDDLQVDAKVEIVEGAGGSRSLRARARFAAGDVIAPLTGGMVDAPGRYTLEVGGGWHVEPDAPVRYLDHGCDPNVFVDTEARVCVALRGIEPGEALTIWYPATEWQMASPFACRCGAAGCLGRVSGAVDVPRAVLARHRLAPHVSAALDGMGE